MYLSSTAQSRRSHGCSYVTLTSFSLLNGNYSHFFLQRKNSIIFLFSRISDRSLLTIEFSTLRTHCLILSSESSALGTFLSSNSPLLRTLTSVLFPLNSSTLLYSALLSVSNSTLLSVAVYFILSFYM